MEVAKITSRGQVTIPIEIRKKLGVKEGDKIIFLEEAGRIVVVNSAKVAFANMRAAFAGEAERLGLKTEEDVVALVDEVRDEMWKERYAGND
ncbi:MAG: AbrB/MazE/SpoVT family DNA-binding domain-containing protein [Oscillospiraceae bacterium]|jgi:AbrB family looped-hinge helix DNA binding protein|nr:AbrB/MazE/SpoVT family DNA-binding domain-containing protein [Oscillospiraceae bacterium]